MSSDGLTVPKGYRFHPSDEELLSDLELKNQCKDSQLIIPEIDVCKYEPRQLPELISKRTQNLLSKFFSIFFWFIRDEYSWGSQGKWYFFTPRDYKYKNSSRSNRTTGKGFYKITGKDRPIKAPGSNVVIGRKRTLTFYQRGGPKPQRTGWVIHEYYLIQDRSDPPTQIGEFVVCCLKYKSDNSDHDKDAPPCKGNHYEAENGGGCSEVENQADGNGNEDQIPNGKDDEAETGGGMITQEEEYRAYKELEDALQLLIGNQHEFNGNQTDPCHTDQTTRSNFVQGQPDRSNSSDMVEEEPPQLHQLQPPQEPPIFTTNVPECRKRPNPYEYNDPSLLKKNNISTNDDDIHVINSASSENQAANVVPEGNRELRFNQPQQPPDDCYSSAMLSPASLELEAVLQTNGTSDDCNELQSPFGDSESCPVDRNEFSTCHEDENVCDVFLQLHDPVEENLDSLFGPLQPQAYIPSTPQSPRYPSSQSYWEGSGMGIVE